MNTYRRVKADPADWFAPEEVQKAKDYQRPLTVARIVSLVLNLGLMIAIISTHAAPRLLDRWGIDAWALRLIVVLVGVMVVFEIVDLPISIWTTFVHERKWEFSTETPGGFVADQFKSLALGIVLFSVLFFPLWLLIRTTSLWWIAGWAVFFVFTVVLGILFPIVIAPIFNKFTPLADADLGARLRSLAEGVGMRVKAIEVMDASKRTRKDNAYFAGLGRTRQIVVFDNLLEQPHAVVASVVGHELGHWRRRHVAKSIVLGAATSIGVFAALRYIAGWRTALDWAGVTSLRDPASFPLVALVFVAAFSVTGLLSAWVSRAHERQADVEALDITDDYDAFIECERGLSTKNLIDLAPSWWRYVRASHPPPAERLQIAEVWRADRESV